MRPLLSTPDLDAHRRRVLGDLIELLLHGERDLHRAARDHRAGRHQRFELDVELAAIAAAEIRHFDAYFVFRPAEQPRDLRSHERRSLRAAMDRQAGVLVVGDRGERLERHVQAFLRAEFVLEHLRRRGESLVDVAAPRFGIECEIGVLLALEMLEVGEGARRASARHARRSEAVIASTSSNTGGSSSYSATIACVAASATCGSAASTTATGSPTKRTFSIARIG